MEQLTIIAGATPAQQEAAAMHFEIVEAAKGAVNSLLDLCLLYTSPSPRD